MPLGDTSIILGSGASKANAGPYLPSLLGVS
jgi:hypothetical protein